MTARHQVPGREKTLIDLPTVVKAQIRGLAQVAHSTDRLEIIAAMIAWHRHPDPEIRAEATRLYDRRPRKREDTP